MNFRDCIADQLKKEKLSKRKAQEALQRYDDIYNDLIAKGATPQDAGLQAGVDALARATAELHESARRKVADILDAGPRVSVPVALMKYDPSPRPGESPGQAVVRFMKESAETIDDGGELLQRAQRALADKSPEATVDLGHGPMRLDHEVTVAAPRDADGRHVPERMTWRQILEEFGDDEAMIRAIQVCAR